MGTKHKNTRDGYEIESAERIPDGEDPGVGYSAGSLVRIIAEHDLYSDEVGEVYAVARGTGWHAGALVVDVLIEGTNEPERFETGEIAEVL
jgi:hypothetical protein